MKPSNFQSACGLFISIAVCLGIGGLGAALTTPEIDGWYRTIAKPSWNPPDAVFGPVWTTLYLMMAIAAWLVWRQAGFKTSKIALILFSSQLVLNLAWSLIFFRMHAMGFAFFELVALWVLIAFTMIAFLQHSRLAGVLMGPYLAWVSFAGVLNFAIWQLNR